MATDQAVKFFEQGFLHLPKFASKMECQGLVLRMRELCERVKSDSFNTFLAGERQSKDEYFQASANNISFFFDPKAKVNGEIKPFKLLNKVGHALHERCPVYHRFSSQPKFFELMHELGQKKPALIQTMFIFKQPLFGDAVPAHQDATFLYTEPNSAIGLWFALEDADEHNGCLWVMPSGHLGPLKHRFMRDSNGMSFFHEQKVRWPKKDFVPLPVKAGDAIVLHGFLPHFSEQNTSQKTRHAFTIHFIDKKCHYPKSNWLLSLSGGLEQERK